MIMFPKLIYMSVIGLYRVFKKSPEIKILWFNYYLFRPTYF